MTPRELLGRASIGNVWAGLGGAPLRRNRACAFWRGSESFSVSISCERNVFFDFGPGEGGGVLRLIETALGCDRREAVDWLAAFCNISLDDRPLSIERRRVWQWKRRKAEARASDLVRWREDLLFELRQRRDAIWECVRAAERFGKAFVGEPGRDDLWNFAFECIAEEKEGDRLDNWVAKIEDMTPAELIELRGRMAAREALAA